MTLSDLVVGAAFVLTLGFGYAAYAGNDGIAAALAGCLAVAGILRLVTIVIETYWPDR
ncbi:MAG: hypothetical protein HY873_03395 [Chloroflexi bacterium]|nr:hypothetical protein [Chloroflexota bacterium]